MESFQNLNRLGQGRGYLGKISFPRVGVLVKESFLLFDKNRLTLKTDTWWLSCFAKSKMLGSVAWFFVWNWTIYLPSCFFVKSMTLEQPAAKLNDVTHESSTFRCRQMFANWLQRIKVVDTDWKLSKCLPACHQLILIFSHQIFMFAISNYARIWIFTCDWRSNLCLKINAFGLVPAKLLKHLRWQCFVEIEILIFKTHTVRLFGQ